MISSRAELFEKLSLGATVLTPNARLTKVLAESYDATQTQEVWPSPFIYPFNQWLEQLWEHYSVTNSELGFILMTELQSNLIWLDLIKDHALELYNTEALAKKIKQAWGYCLAWQIDSSAEIFDRNEETAFFKSVIEKYKSLTQNKVSQAELLNLFIGFLKKKVSLNLPKTIILAYFDDFTPAQQEFWMHLKQYQPAIEILYFDEEKQPSTINRIEVETEKEELECVVNWIKDKSQSGTKQLGVVVSNLQQIREPLEILLLKHFKKEEFNISIGRALDQFSIVNNALSLLSMPSSHISLEQVHLLCHSSFVGKATSEAMIRSDIFHALQTTTEKMFYIKTFLKALGDTWLEGALKQLISSLHAPGKQTVSQWSDIFISSLAAIGFPGEQILSSDEYQVYMRFSQALVEFSSLSDGVSYLSKSEAIHLFEWQLKQIIFQPKAHDSKIQFIGFLESLGLQFDALWVMGLSEFQLPQKLNPSAFIPIDLQRENHMPHACEERELSLAKKHIRRLSHSADEIIFSHHFECDGVTVQASPLIVDYPLLTIEQPLAFQSERNDNLEFINACEKVPVFDIANIRGGSYLIKEQAQCPFRAFSKFKLKLPEPRDNIEGLDGLDRGILIHRIMELFWSEVGDQKQLVALYEAEQLESFLATVIDKALINFQKKKPYTFNQSFTRLEKKRLKKIIMRYLTLEMDRPPFKVLHIEFESLFIVDELNIKLRVDRIDELENGDWLVIDYKTGNPTISSLFEARLTEPQLPIYALAENKIKAVLYAQMQQRAVKNKGISQDELDIKGVKVLEKQQKISWQEQCEQWEDAVSLLAKEFIVGEITPTPVSETLCSNCAYLGLCGAYRN